MRIRHTSAAAALVVTGVLLPACSGGSSPATPPDHSKPVDLQAVSLTSAERRDLAAADDVFGAKLFAAVAGEDDSNVVMSPVSVAIALQMAFAGARGDTAAEMADTLQVGDIAPTDVAAAAAKFLADLAPLADGKHSLLSLVNQVWVQDGFPLTTSYRTAMESGFAAGLRRVDFRDDAAAATQEINDAVAVATHDRIKDLIPSPLESSTRLVLTNAVYLLARWVNEFDPGDTRPKPFHLADGTSVEVPTMRQQNEFDYVDGDGYQAVVLPYGDLRLAMTLLIPDDDLRHLEKRLAAHGVSALTADAKYTPLTISLPRFRFSWNRELSGPLRDLGMPTAFTDSADFTGITRAESLRVQGVLHKAFIAVDEEGTEAAAATAVIMAGSGVRLPPEHPVVVRADHPFLFAITDTKTGLPLFLGRVSDPR